MGDRKLTAPELVMRDAVLALRMARLSFNDAVVAVGEVSMSDWATEADAQGLEDHCAEIDREFERMVDTLARIIGHQSLTALLAPELDAAAKASGPRDIRDKPVPLADPELIRPEY